jgi:glycosyltransferase involved in cell wall biosynthesis
VNLSPMHILIVEEQLCDERSHHLQYLSAIGKEAISCGVAVDIAVNNRATAAVTSRLNVASVLHDVSGLAGRGIGGIRSRWRRGAALCQNTLRNGLSIRRLMATHGPYEFILCFTAWWPHLTSLLLVKWTTIGHKLGFGVLFVNYPRLRQKATLQLLLVRLLVRLLGKNLTVFAETGYAQKAWHEFLKRPVHLLVHPVELADKERAHIKHTVGTVERNERIQERSRLEQVPEVNSSKPVVFGFYGLARYEQGADLLLLALERLVHNGGLPGEFRILWPAGFRLPNGEWFDKSQFPNLIGRVCFFEMPFEPETYMQMLKQTDWIILPYRPSSYAGRLSRISVEACVLGIPVIVAAGTDCAEVVSRYGAGLSVKAEDVTALAEGIITASQSGDTFAKKAAAQRQRALLANSAHEFWRGVLDGLQSSATVRNNKTSGS